MLERAELGLRGTGDPKDTKLADQLGKRIKESGDFPLPETESLKIYPEISLEQEWQRQAQGLVNHGFHSELGLTQNKYLESLPKFTSQPESFKGRLDTPVLVETRISPKRQSELAGIQYFLDGLNVGDWDKDPKTYKTPDSAYATWTDEGAGNMNKKVKDVRRRLGFDERGGTVFDGVALYIVKPSILEKRFLDLPGTLVESDCAPSLNLWLGKPELGHYWVGNANPGFGSLVCGRQK